MRGLRGLVVLVVAALAVLCACSSGPVPAARPATPTPGPWAQRALDWLAAEYAAGVAGVPYLAPYLSPGLVVDHRCCLGRTVEGRDAWLAAQLQIFPEGLQEKVVGDPYLDADGELLSVRQGLADETWDLAVLRSYDENGVRRMRYALSLQIARGRTLDHAPYDAVDRLVRDYVAAWSGGDRAAVARIYAPGVRLTDTVDGLSLQGSDAVAAAAGRTAATLEPARMTLTRLPELYRTANGQRVDGGPAVYVTGSSPDDVAQVWLRATTTRTTQRCAQDLAVVLTLDHGRIAEERRLHGVTSVRRCARGPIRAAGWWDALPPPPPPATDRVTGTLAAPGGPIEIRNGTPGLQALVAWGLQRFRVGGLPAPSVRSVTFQTGVRQCADVAGLARAGAGGEALVLCFDQADVCTDATCRSFTLVARTTVLHELAHAWLDGHVGETARAFYVAREGLRSWSDAADRWQDRGAERAAETMAWGLLDVAWAPVRIGSPSCVHLADGYRLLTGASPVAPCR